MQRSNKRLNVTLPWQTMSRLDDIRADKGLANYSTILTLAVEEYHKRHIIQQGDLAQTRLSKQTR